MPRTSDVRAARTVVIVEGISDRVAIETLAERRGRDLAADGVAVVPIGGAQRIGAYLAQLRAERPDVAVAGLCDAGEERHFRRGLERAGLGADLHRTAMEELGFFVCVVDLEDELIRAVGAAAVQAVAAEQGDLRAFRTLQQQPAWLGRPVEEQLRRWLGSGGRRKTRYARFLVEALDDARVPRPLAGLLAYV
ncbi:MAG: ATP-dependent endonuclease [Thermoleophilia bacterium]|nr:ATP-dependent endonuclease [Thermoleophilia bacterium]